MSYNIQSGFGMDGICNIKRIAKQINKIKPDILGVQVTLIILSILSFSVLQK